MSEQELEANESEPRTEVDSNVDAAVDAAQDADNSAATESDELEELRRKFRSKPVSYTHL